MLMRRNTFARCAVPGYRRERYLLTRGSSEVTLTLNLPPYGCVNADNVAFLAKRPVPAGFRANPDGPVASAREWEQWRDRLAGEMADFLWPVFGNKGWTGKAVGSGRSSSSEGRADRTSASRSWSSRRQSAEPAPWPASDDAIGSAAGE